MSKEFCKGCNSLAVEQAASKNNEEYVFLRCMPEEHSCWSGRVLAHVKAQYAALEADNLCRPAWCTKGA